MSNYTKFPWVPRETNGPRMGWSVGPAWLGSTESQRNADRHLISAAPDLLEALEEIMKDQDSIGYRRYFSYLLDAKARAAIAKARGLSDG